MGLSLEHAFHIGREVIEREVRRLARVMPRGHDAVLAQAVLAASPTLWRVYREGIGRGLLPEFEKPRPTQTPRQQLFQQIDRELRRIVVQSARPMTMRAAIVQLFRERPDLFIAYDQALKEERAAIRTRRRKV